MSVTTCERCGQQIGAPHRLLTNDCILSHADHTERFIGLICKRHYHWISDTLRQVEDLFALRDDVILPGPGTSERHGTRDGSPAPGRIAIMAITDARAKTPIDLEGVDDIPDVVGTLGSWARLALEEVGDVSTQVRTLAESVRVLLDQRRFIAGQSWVDDYVTELGAVHRHVASAVGDTMWPRPVGRCPYDQTWLYNTIGIDEITCRRCKVTWAGVALARLRLIHEQEAAKS